MTSSPSEQSSVAPRCTCGHVAHAHFDLLSGQTCAQCGCCHYRPELRNGPRLLDLFCCQGGAGMGYALAGFEVVGVDLTNQPRYPFEFWQADALAFLDAHWQDFDAFHASPPCQLYSKTQRIRDNDHPDLIGPVRELFEATGKPWVIENVEDARPWLRDPVMLCGAMFPGLLTYRHRLFESNVPLTIPEHPTHTVPLRKMGRRPVEGEFMHVVGNFTDVAYAKRAMGIDWMTRDGLRESIPPAYTHHIGEQLLVRLAVAA